MRLQDLNGKQVCIVGFGKEGRAMFDAIQDYAPYAHVTIADKNPEPINALIAENATRPLKLKSGITTQAGETVWLRAIESFDVIIPSPGIPPSALPPATSHLLTSSTQIFLEEAAAGGSLVIGVTGSKGKSTTSAMIAHILRQAGKNVHLVGNIGEPAIAHVGDIRPDAFFVCEMSSYQLMRITQSPPVAVITSFFPEHLDYHHSLESYRNAKANIARFQTEAHHVFFPHTDAGGVNIAREGKGNKHAVTPEAALVSPADAHLLGEHNRGNIALACSVATHLGVPNDVIRAALQSFTPLPHRLQSLGVHHGAEWVDDAIAVAPDATIAAIDALEDRVRILLLGGQDRGVDMSALAERIARSSITDVILFPDSGLRIRAALNAAGARAALHDCRTMEEAVTIAISAITSHEKPTTYPVILLSPASPSYGHFRNFEEKGAAFARAVRGA